MEELPYRPKKDKNPAHKSISDMNPNPTLEENGAHEISKLTLKTRSIEESLIEISLFDSILNWKSNKQKKSTSLPQKLTRTRSLPLPTPLDKSWKWHIILSVTLFVYVGVIIYFKFKG